MKDNYDLWVEHDLEQERMLEGLPVCKYCGDPIQDEHYYEIDGEIYCEEHMIELFRRDTDSYCGW
jgi:hypothetical protein